MGHADAGSKKKKKKKKKREREKETEKETHDGGKRKSHRHANTHIRRDTKELTQTARHACTRTHRSGHARTSLFGDLYTPPPPLPPILRTSASVSLRACTRTHMETKHLSILQPLFPPTHPATRPTDLPVRPSVHPSIHPCVRILT